MEFVLVNGRTPRPQSFCVLCCEPIGESDLREIETRLSYCNHRPKAALAAHPFNFILPMKSRFPIGAPLWRRMS
jgi:hypothetical protein